ncbi:MAG TPA: BatA domain-containing protein [Pirellulales bacterium]|nr:BatA domain-containing protein [Pirellulales bacterium]
MSSFVNPSLLWALALVGVPVLIHLINLLRHRRVPWAAMEFLLESQRRNSTWIKLKQLLLLLLRMAAVAGVVLLVAQPIGCNQLGRFLGGRKTQHIVLLDDSFSMADRWANTSAFDEAKKVVERIGDEVSRQPMSQSFTLLRFSRAGRAADGTPADFYEERVGSDFGRRLSDRLRSLRPSQRSVGPDAALRAADGWIDKEKDEDRVLYLVSDFRANDWQESDQLAKTLARLDSTGVQLKLINCVDAAHANLAITSLEPVRGTRAAGTPFYMAVTVTNFGSDPMESVPVILQEDAQPRPALTIDRIGAGESETRRFSVYFKTAGEHTIAASIASDPLAIDNLRFAVVDLPPSVPVLLLDGDRDFVNARYLAAALAPGGAVKTGIDPQIESPAYLNNKPLDKFQAVYLLDVGRLDQPAIDALEKYVQAGGGLGVFLGDNCRPAFYNEKLYREGQGFFPLPLLAKTQLLVDRLEKGADLEITDHAIFRVFSGERNSYLSAVGIDWYMSAPRRWSPDPKSTTRVLASLRNRAPLCVEKKFGEGRVVAFMTTAAPLWNNWSRNPSFVVAMLEMQSYLAVPPTLDAGRVVGAPIELDFDPGRYQPEVRMLAPTDGVAGGDADAPAALPAGGISGDDATTLVTSAAAQNGSKQMRAAFPEAATSGIYELQLKTVDNKVEVRRLAFNVEADEGNLTTLGAEELRGKLQGVAYDYRQADEFRVAVQDLAGTNLSQWMIGLLVALLLGEQAVAYSASYHPTGAR